jgi:multiple sugar transport system permease protein
MTTDTIARVPVAAPERPVQPKRRKSRENKSHWLLHLCLIAGAIIMIYPLLWMLGGSFKPDKDIFSQISPIPTTWKFDNFGNGWNATDPAFYQYYLNSLLICALAVIGNLFACTLTAYAFARLKFRGKKIWFAIMIASIMLPTHALLIPQYIVYFNLGWVNTILPLVVPKFLATDAFFVFLMVQFIRTIPRSLDEAATLDGCGPIRIFTRIMLPLLGPALVTTVIFTFIWTYNDFFSQLIYLSSPTSETVPVALRQFVDATGSSSYGQLLAMSVLSLVPTFIVFLVSQRRIVEGIATTGIRG